MTSLEPEVTSYDADDVAAPRPPSAALDIADTGERDERFSDSVRKRNSREDRGSEADRVNRAQIRGGQDCTDRGHPTNIDAAKYLQSAHCLRFSDLW